MFKYRDLKTNPIPRVEIGLKSAFVNQLTRELEERTGMKAWVVGGGVRQLVREIWWGKNLNVLKSVSNFIVENSRDFDILLEGEQFCKQGDAKFQELTDLVKEVANRFNYNINDKVIDLIQMTDYFDKLDLASNAVLYDGQKLTFLGLFQGEDYINLNNKPGLLNRKTVADGHLRLRWLINHSHLRPGNKIWFSHESQEVDEELKMHYYYKIYEMKLDALKKMYP